MKEIILDVLAERYGSEKMVEIWSPRNKIRQERQLWVAVLKGQADLGLPVPADAVAKYESVICDIDLDEIAALEQKRRHDVKARIEVFNTRAGAKVIHQGFTSRDLTDNVEQLQIFSALCLIRDKSVAILSHLLHRMVEFELLDICGRSHNVVGQTTTLGKRFGNVSEEFLLAFSSLQELIARYPLRGMKGAMGTMQDQADLLGSAEAASRLDKLVLEHLGLPRLFDCVGQVYPRSLDFDTVSRLTQLTSAPANLAKLIRLMAGFDQAQEGFAKEQVGSTAQPHKMNSRTCERVNALARVVGGFQHMTEALLGDQWFEGDVSCSVIRRVALPGAFLALDGLFEALLTVLRELTTYPAVIKLEIEKYLPFLSSTRLLMAALKKGKTREEMHDVIKRHAVAALQSMRSGGPQNFASLLADDPEFPLAANEIEPLVTSTNHGLASTQVQKMVGKITPILEQFPEAAKYVPAPIL